MKWFYWLTQWYPRVMPQTTYEIEELKDTLTTYFGIEDDPAVWMNIMGEIVSTRRSTMRKSLRKLAIIGNRVLINKACHDFQMIENNRLQDKLKAKIEEVVKSEEFSGAGGSDSDLRCGTLDPSQGLPEVQDPF